MITRKRDHGSGTSEWYCKSTDVKPTDDYPKGPYNADPLLEIDTGNVFCFDAETKTWLKQ